MDIWTFSPLSKAQTLPVKSPNSDASFVGTQKSVCNLSLTSTMKACPVRRGILYVHTMETLHALLSLQNTSTLPSSSPSRKRTNITTSLWGGGLKLAMGKAFFSNKLIAHNAVLHHDTLITKLLILFGWLVFRL